MLHTNLLILLLLIVAFTIANNHNQNQNQHPLLHHPQPTMSKSLNIFRQPLTLHSTSPITGYLRNGYCEVPASDYGSHSIAAIVTEEFLDFTASKGNDLRSIGGMKAGCKWCLCASRWYEAFEARGREAAGDKIVPKVVLSATNEKALQKVRKEDLEMFKAEE